MITSNLITPRHLTLKAIIYIRQSTHHQVISNQESLKLQYNLKQKALEWGWPEQQIETIDRDLGLTGSTAEHRNGFKDLVTQVTLGKVGMILSYDVTRLSRNCSDWYPLLDVCGYKGCLIADYDSVYDPGSSNGRLLLGLKGQLAEVELNTIRSRLNAGILNKAKRGDLALKLPVGLIRNDQGDVQQDPHQEVQQRIDLVFESFLRVQSTTKVMKYFNEHQLLLPRYDKFGDLYWKTPSVASLCCLLKNPAYAGVFVYGRTRTTRIGPSAIDQKQTTLPMEEWKIVVKDKYPAYISWDTFEKIQGILKDNYAEYDRNKTRGVPRKGAALLHGIMVCGECGHKMVVQYKQVTRYICNYLRQQHGCKVCQYLPADAIDDEVVKVFFEALSVVELDAYADFVESQQRAQDQLKKAKALKAQRLRYEAQLAERQFQKVDPDNRLVAAELERRWEQALRALRQAEEQSLEVNQPKPLTLSREMKNIFLQIGKNLPQLWHQQRLSQQQRKAFLRCLIEKVIARRSSRDQLDVRIVWVGGATTTLAIPIHVGSFNELTNAQAMEKTIVKLAQKGKTDQEIAACLTEQGDRSPMDNTQVLPSTVQSIRLKNGILVTRSQSHPRKVAGYLTVPQVAKQLGITPHWLYDRIHNGTIVIDKDEATGLYLFPDRQAVIDQMNGLKNGSFKKFDFSEEYQDV